MGDVVSFFDRAPHSAGRAKCLGCSHEWDAVAAIGSECLECHECGMHKGEFMGNYVPSVEDDVYVCNCGSDSFFVLRTGVFCRGCGAETPFFDLVD